MGIKEIFSDFFIKGSPLDKKSLITDDDLKPAYKKQKAITSYLPWLDIIEENKILKNVHKKNITSHLQFFFVKI